MKNLYIFLILTGLVFGQEPRIPPTQTGPLSVFVRNGEAIPSYFFGITSNHSFNLQIPYGQFRIWDTPGQWVELESCKAASGNPSDPCFNWSSLDTVLSATFTAGVNDVFFTMSRSPLWAVNLNSDPTGMQGKGCDYYSTLNGVIYLPGQCLMPTDLNSDGSGTNQMWKNWITAIATYTNNPTYLKTHSHIAWWEPWNEVHRSTIIANPPYQGASWSFEGTFAQLLRFTEDARCIILGKGIIHNYPKAGQSTTCTNKAIDPKAFISSPSTGLLKPAIDVTKNFLYCIDPPANSQCNTGSAGSAAVDGINYHMYATNRIPEVNAFQNIPIAKSTLSQTDLKKPLIDGEGSWGAPGNGDIWSDKYAQAGFIPRYFALYWTMGVAANYWYSYDQGQGGWGALSNGFTLYHPQSDGWVQTYTWLQGAMPVNNQFCIETGTIITCQMINKEGKSTQLTWDSMYGQNCSQMANPVICGQTVYPVPSQYNKDWVDVTGVIHPFSATVQIGANPILLEAQ